MPVLKDIKVHIRVARRPLAEWGAHVAEDGKQVACYIEGDEGDEFNVYVELVKKPYLELDLSKEDESGRIERPPLILGRLYFDEHQVPVKTFFLGTHSLHSKYEDSQVLRDSLHEESSSEASFYEWSFARASAEMLDLGLLTISGEAEKTGALSKGKEALAHVGKPGMITVRFDLARPGGIRHRLPSISDTMATTKILVDQEERDITQEIRFTKTRDATLIEHKHPSWQYEEGWDTNPIAVFRFLYRDDETLYRNIPGVPEPRRAHLPRPKTILVLRPAPESRKRKRDTDENALEANDDESKKRQKHKEDTSGDHDEGIT